MDFTEKYTIRANLLLNKWSNKQTFTAQARSLTYNYNFRSYKFCLIKECTITKLMSQTSELQLKCT